MQALEIPDPDLLAQAFAIAANQSPLLATRAHLQAIVLHARQWTTTVMEATSPQPQPKTIRCEHPGCIDGWIASKTAQSGKVECPICEGQPNIDYTTHESIVHQLRAAMAHQQEMIAERQGLLRQMNRWRDNAAQASRLSNMREMPKPKPGVPATLGGAA